MTEPAKRSGDNRIVSATQGRAYAWLGPLRTSLRAALFNVFRGAAETDDGRRILAGSLHGLLPHDPSLGQAEYDGRVPSYPDLGRPADAAAPVAAPVFITGRFRSGSTLLWNIFRHVDGCTSYYEPLNERRWFEPAARGSHTDPTHVGVSDYWLEYEGLERLGEFYRESWIDRHFYMDAFFWDSNLRAYVQTLIDAASPRRAVLQFNRVDFRLAWLRRTFPEARLIHIYRHPRDQWCSALRDLAAFSKDDRIENFEPHDRFYLLSWARDLQYQFPFLDERTVSHPYDLFYYIWKLSYVFGLEYSDHSVCFERLVAEPKVELPRLMNAAGVNDYDQESLTGLIVGQRPGKWRQYASEGWFSQREGACEEVLAAFCRREMTPTPARRSMPGTARPGLRFSR
jgi:hypothetical protein